MNDNYIKDTFIPLMIKDETELPKTVQELTDYCVELYEIIKEEESKVGHRNNLN